ncbi:LCP family protein [Exiguobacterium sp. S22-S28]|uniref:LCP family protein n=1 Tax=Exiguobacterium sp. S22-S28 TaxID=3342768 RepID=UPI00372D6BCD
MDESRQSRSQKHKKPKKRWFRIFVITFLVVLIAGGATFAYVANKTFQTAKQSEVELSRGDKSEKRAAAVDLTKDHFSVLLVGTDERKGDTSSRADTMIVATFNKAEQSISMLSIPRDSLVMIPSVGYEDKINHSYAYGGIDSTIETVESLLDIPIDYYGAINFNGVVAIVDAVGGIDVDVKLPIDTLNSSDKQGGVKLEPGLQRLNGEEALAYARMRYQDPEGDIGRTKRQQQVVQAIIDQSTSFGSITKLNKLMDATGDNFTTNMSLTEAFQLQPFAKSLNAVNRIDLKGTDTKINGTYYYQLDPASLSDAKSTLKEQLNLPQTTDDFTSTPEVTDDSTTGSN